MKVRKKLIKVGNSVAVVIPNIWADMHGFTVPDNDGKDDKEDKDDKFIILDMRDDGTILIEPEVVSAR